MSRKLAAYNYTGKPSALNDAGVRAGGCKRRYPKGQSRTCYQECGCYLNWSRGIPDAKLQCSVRRRLMILGLLLHVRLTESTDSTDLHAWEHFQYWFVETPGERFLTLFEKLSKFFFLHFTWGAAPGCFAAQLYNSATPLGTALRNTPVVSFLQLFTCYCSLISSNSKFLQPMGGPSFE